MYAPATTDGDTAEDMVDGLKEDGVTEDGVTEDGVTAGGVTADGVTAGGVKDCGFSGSCVRRGTYFLFFCLCCSSCPIFFQHLNYR